MAYAILNNYIDRSLYPLKAPYAMVPEYITIHNTYNDATALNEIAYMHRNKAPTSYHVAVDDKHVVQAIPFNRNAWHAGDGQGKGNRASIGIEICYSKSGGERYEKAEANTVEYVAQLLKQYGWGIDRVKWHRDWSGKKCPHRIIDEGRLQTFKNQIAARLTVLNGAITTVASVQTSEKKEVDPMAELLPKTQQDDMRKLLKRAYDDEVFSVDHTPRVDKMTRGEATDLLISYVARKSSK